MRATTTLLAGIVMLGCQRPDTAEQLPTTVAAAVEELRTLATPIIDAVRTGNPGGADEQIHSAMYYADHLPDIAKQKGVDDQALQTISRCAKSLYDLLTAAHDGWRDGTGKPSGDEFETQMLDLIDSIAETANGHAE